MEDLNFQALEVGKPLTMSYAKNSVNTWLDYSSTGLTIFVGYPRMTDSEIDLFKNGDFEIGLFIRNGIVVFPYRFHHKHITNKSFSFNDIPFHPAFLNEDTYEKNFEDDLEELNNNHDLGILLNVVAFDTTTGIIKNLRSLSLSNNFSKSLLKTFIELEPNKISGQEFTQIASAIQSNYSSKEIFKNSQYRYFHRSKRNI